MTASRSTTAIILGALILALAWIFWSIPGSPDGEQRDPRQGGRSEAIAGRPRPDRSIRDFESDSEKGKAERTRNDAAIRILGRELGETFPIPGAIVDYFRAGATDAQPTTMSADATGLVHLHPDRYLLKVTEQGFFGREVELDLDSKVTEPVPLVLDKIPSIEGAVLDPQGDPVSDVKVFAGVRGNDLNVSRDLIHREDRGVLSSSTTSDEEGRYHLSLAPLSADFQVCFEHPFWGRWTVDVGKLEPGEKRRVDALIPDHAGIYGRVPWAPAGSGSAFVELFHVAAENRLNRQESRCTIRPPEQGFFFENVSPGTKRLTYQRDMGTQVDIAFQELVLEEGESSNAGELQVLPTRLVVRVQAPADVSPERRLLLVTLIKSRRPARSFYEFKFETSVERARRGITFQGFPDWRMTIRAELRTRSNDGFDDRYRSASSGFFSFLGDQDIELEVRERKDEARGRIELVWRPGGEDSEVPTIWAWVIGQGRVLRATGSSSSSRQILGGIPAGEWSVQYVVNGQAGVADDIVVLEGETTHCELRTNGTPCRRLSGLVRTSEGAPAAGAVVRVVAPSYESDRLEEVAQATVNAAGEYQIEALPDLDGLQVELLHEGRRALRPFPTNGLLDVRLER